MDLFPRSIDFFKRFDELAHIIKKSSTLLTYVEINSKKISPLALQARKLEVRADNICHDLHHEVNLAFITPIDREDIYILARNLDNVVDFIENLFSQIATFSIKEEEPEFRQFVKLIISVTEFLASLIKLLKFREKYIPEMRKLIVKINKVENEGDELLRKAYKSLFSNHTNAVEIIKWKDMYTTMEVILDECENVAYIVDEIIIKNF